jgi:hypothetical protein
MKRILLIATCAAALSAYGLPTYEPFTEFGPTIASSPVTLVVTTNGVSLGANANSSIPNCLDLATGGYSAPSGESWGILNFSGTMPNNVKQTRYVTNGLDIAVISNATVFTQIALSSLLPSTFPGFPPANGYITNMVENPAQPLIYNGSTFTASNFMGNSAVLKFASDITRPTSGTKTLYVSYLFSVAQAGQLGAGNNGRYLGFLSATNLSEGWIGNAPVAGAFYTNWFGMFNTFNSSGGTNRYACHGLLADGSSYYIGACDSGVGKNWPSTPFVGSYNTPIFVVGEYVLNSGTNLNPIIGNLDTNIMWVNPATSSFGGATPPTTGIHVLTLTNFTMSDLGGLVFIDRSGNLASGGVGTNYIANLIIGSTWSYVTGGPEFTTQPPTSTTVSLGGNTSITAGATAAGQTVSYQWVKIVGTSTNNVNPGSGGAGGSAFVSGQNSATLTLNGVSAGDTGNYQLVATASSTGYTLNSATAAVALPDPTITAGPANATANYQESASFTSAVTTVNAPLTYGWYDGTTPLSNGLQPDGSYAIGATGATGAGSSFSITLTLTNVSYLDVGNYSLYVTNHTGVQYNIAGPAALAVIDPYIVTQPTNPVVAAGGNATFTVQAAGSPTLSYQWYEGTPPSGTQLFNGNTTASGATIGISSGAGSSTLTLGGSGVQDADNGSYYCTVTGSASLQTINSATATLVVGDPLTIVSPPVSLTERVGDHLAFSVGVTGGGPQFQWYAPNGSPIAGATTSALVLTNITTGSTGTYRVAVGNAATPFQNFNATLTVINSTILDLSSANLVVARVGDGAQTLSSATGNTLYLDQYTTSGAYVNTIQIPDEGTGQPYGTGGSSSASMPFGSPALLVQGAGVDAEYEAMLTLSANQNQYLCFAGYCEPYPFTGGALQTGATSGAYWRGIGLVNAFGVYSLAYTNSGLFSGGNQAVHSAVTLDGTNFWIAGEAGSVSGVKYVNAGSAGAGYANGSGIPSVAGSTTGPRSIQITGGYVVFSDVAASPQGLYANSYTPLGILTSANILDTGANEPNDFAFSPDGQTVYIADAEAFGGATAQSGGIQRWDTNTAGGGWTWSYTLPAEPTQTSGAQGLTVYFPPGISSWGPGVVGATIYATSTGTASNTLASIVDNGITSTPTVLVTASANQALRGVRFGPSVVAPYFTVQPQSQTNFPGNSVTLSASAAGSSPFTYQWYYNNTPIAGATGTSFTTNGVTVASSGSYSLVVSNPAGTAATSAVAVVTITLGTPVITLGNEHYTETVGDHVGFAPLVVGSFPITNYWYFGSTLVQSNVMPPAANAGLSLANIQTTNTGSYTLLASNLYGHASTTNTLTVTTSLQNLASNNLVVARIGDGVQALSGATGNTLYLDQYTPAGVYVNTVQIPDEGIGQPYGTGGADSTSMPFGSLALTFPGAGSDVIHHGLLTLSPNGPDGQALSFAGYCEAYPFSGTDVSASAGNGSNQWRGVAEINGFGYYTLPYTNTGLYSGGSHAIHSAVDFDGTGTSFYSAGLPGSGGIKYLVTSFQPASGGGIVAIGGSANGCEVPEVINGNLVFSDGSASPPGIYMCSGLPTAPTTPTIIITDAHPVDFAESPDGNTVYVSDSAAFGGTSVQAGGIQRWDMVGGVYTFSYTLATAPSSTVGALGLTVDFSANTTWGAGVTGAKVYATTADVPGNRLVKVVDNGPASAATTLVTANPGQLLTGLRFGPIVAPPSFTGALQPETAIVGDSATFTSGAVGTGPLSYQWYFQAGGVGPTNAIAGATNATYTISPARNGNLGNYFVVVVNAASQHATNGPVALTLLPPPVFTPSTYPGPSGGLQLNFTGPAGYNYTIWTSTDITLSPVESTWTMLATGSFSGGVDSVTDPNGGTNPQQFYIISVP